VIGGCSWAGLMKGWGDDLGACCQYLWVWIIITSWDLGLRRLQVVLADAEGLLDVA